MHPGQTEAPHIRHVLSLAFSEPHISHDLPGTKSISDILDSDNYGNVEIHFEVNAS